MLHRMLRRMLRSIDAENDRSCVFPLPRRRVAPTCQPQQFGRETTMGTSLQLRSLVKSSGELELSLVSVPIPVPAADEVVVRIEGAPINPSDLGLLLGPADIGSAKVTGSGADTV